MRLDTGGAASSFHDHLTVERVAGGQVVSRAGRPADFAGAAHRVAIEYDMQLITDRWNEGPDTLSIGARLARLVAPIHLPLFTLGDTRLEVAATYAAPVAFVDHTGPATRGSETAVLGVCPEDQPVAALGPLVTETIDAGSAHVVTRFWQPPLPRGVLIGYTAPLVRWDETGITGLVSREIVLRGFYSQTQRPGHHNFTTEYIFEPRLEPGLDPAILAELDARDIVLLYVRSGTGGGPAYLMGKDGRLRAL